MSALPGVSGALFPSRYLADALTRDAGTLHPGAVAAASSLEPRLQGWWKAVSARCGPITATRVLFDVVAMPLFGMLGFRARDVAFDGRCGQASLHTPGGATVALIVRPWATRPSATTRDVHAQAGRAGAAWCFVLAPPFLSLVAARGHATRRSIDFALPHVVARPSLDVFLAIARSDAFERVRAAHRDELSRLDALIERSRIYQDRVRRDLQHGVAAALASLAGVCEAAGRLSPRDARDDALTIVYRVLFLLFAESRDCVPHRHAIYARAYAMSRLCRDASRSSDPGSWEGLAAATRLARLGCRTSDLDAPAFNGRLFARASAASLERGRPARRPTRDSERRDAAARAALVALGSRPGPAGRESISFRDLGVEQLGTIYERVLDLPLSNDRERARPRRDRTARHSVARKQTGTFYTPQALTELVVRRTLGPLVSGATADEILALRVLDPAMGSGAFLVASCHYLASAYEHALVDEGRASATDFGDDDRANIRRLVAERCLAGVDRNPTAVQLARLSLWLTTLAAGKPLTFLDHRLRVGDSLIGAWPDDLSRLTDRRRRGSAALPLFVDDDLDAVMRRIARPLGALLERHDDTPRDVRAKETLWRQMAGESSALEPWRLALHVWCARWFWPRDAATPPPDAAESRALVAALLRGDSSLPRAHLDARLRDVVRAAAAHAFFHWPLEFPDVFYDRNGRAQDAPGFDAVVGNPPWEMLRADPLERHQDHDDDDAGIARASSRADRSLLRFVRDCGAYPSCGHGHLNLYQPFVDRALALTRRHGRIGLVLPWGLATDDGAAPLRRRLLDETAVTTIVGVDNAGALFPIHRSTRFMAVTASPGQPTQEIRAAMGLTRASDLDALPAHEIGGTPAFPLRLTPRQIVRISGPSRRLPDIRRADDLVWLERVCVSAPRLGARDGWHVAFGRELNATEARRHLTATGLPVLEGKHVTPFAVDVAAGADRLDRAMAARLLPAHPFERPRLAYRDVSGVTNRTSLIAAVVPAGCVTTHTLLCLKTPLPRDRQHFLCALFNSYVLNAIVRALMGGHVTTTIVEALPVPIWRGDKRQMTIARLGRRLAAAPGSSLAHAVLQALVARLYGLDAVDFARVLETFPLVPAADRDRAARLHERYIARDARTNGAAGLDG
jgi:hypothetical protein